jgi:hypothetical protein
LRLLLFASTFSGTQLGRKTMAWSKFPSQTLLSTDRSSCVPLLCIIVP